jgi:hypothetical protein
MNTALFNNNIVKSLESNTEYSIHQFVQAIESDKFFLTVMGVIVFITGRSLYLELFDECARYKMLHSHYTKKIGLWAILFLYSRSIFHSTILTIVVIMLFPTIFLVNTELKKSST